MAQVNQATIKNQLIHWLKEMDIASIIAQELPPPHENRKRLSYGQYQDVESPTDKGKYNEHKIY